MAFPLSCRTQIHRLALLLGLLFLTPQFVFAKPTKADAKVWRLSKSKIICTDPSGKRVVERRLSKPLWENWPVPKPGQKTVQAYLSDDASSAALFEYDLASTTVTLYLGSGCQPSGIGYVAGAEAYQPMLINRNGVIGFFSKSNFDNEDYYRANGHIVMLSPNGATACSAGPISDFIPSTGFKLTANQKHGQLRIDGVTYVFFSFEKGACYVHELNPNSGAGQIRISEEGRVEIRTIKGWDNVSGFISSEQFRDSGYSPELASRIRVSTPIFTTDHEHQF